MRVFKATYRDRKGQTRQSSKWYVELRDHTGRVRRVVGYTDEKATKEFGRKLERLAALRANHMTPDPALTAWIETLKRATLERLADIGLVDSRNAAGSKSLSKHVKDFEAALLARGNTPGYVKVRIGRVTNIIEACGFKFWSEIEAARIQEHLPALRTPKGEDDPGLSTQSSNYYLSAFKSFCRWMVKERRASESPVSHLSGLNARTDRRVERRALTADECRKLLAAAQKGKTHYGMSGPDRATLYRVALETGLRWNELHSLTRGDFVLDGLRPRVTVQAAYSKHRRDDTLPLRKDLAEALGAYLADRLPEAKAFPMPDRRVGGEIVRADLETAKIEATDGAGRVIDFHGLRHTFISNLAAGGVHPKTAQALARHSSITLTMDRYTHLSVADQSAALDALPDLNAEEADALAATGTDDVDALLDFGAEEADGQATVGADDESDAAVLASCLASQNRSTAISCGEMRHKNEGSRQSASSTAVLESDAESGSIKGKARVAELAYALDLGSSPERGAGSSPAPRTIPETRRSRRVRVQRGGGKNTMKTLDCVLILAVALTALPAYGADGIEAPNEAAAAAAPDASVEAAPADEVLREIEKRQREEAERQEIENKMSLIRYKLLWQFRDNDRWHQEAVEEEREYVREAEEAYEDKDFRRAKDYYMKAVEITYPQWVFTDKVVAFIKTNQAWYKQESFVPSLQKRHFRLSTEYTRLALTRLAVIDRLIDEYELVTARLAADNACESGKLGEAYKRYTDALEIARKMGRNLLAQRYADEIEQRRRAMVAEGGAPLDAAKAALEAGKADVALAALDAFREKYGELVIVTELRNRYRELDALPAIKQERREQAALKKMAIADAAVEREDYRTAIRWYRKAAVIHAGTRAGELAKQKRERMLEDPEIAKAIERQEAEFTCKAMFARAETFAAWGKPDEAAAVYDQVIAKYPGTPWAEEAAKAKEALDAQPADTPPAKQEEKSDENPA